MCLVLDVSKCTWTHVSSVVLLLLSVVLGTAWDYLSCLPFIWIQQKRKTQVLNLKFSLLWSPQATSYVELLKYISLCKEHGSVRFLNLKNMWQSHCVIWWTNYASDLIIHFKLRLVILMIKNNRYQKILIKILTDVNLDCLFQSF